MLLNEYVFVTVWNIKFGRILDKVPHFLQIVKIVSYSLLWQKYDHLEIHAGYPRQGVLYIFSVHGKLLEDILNLNGRDCLAFICLGHHWKILEA